MRVKRVGRDEFVDEFGNVRKRVVWVKKEESNSFLGFVAYFIRVIFKYALKGIRGIFKLAMDKWRRVS